MAKSFDVQGARAAGYSDVEIADHLANESGFDIAGARKAGYSDSEIIGHLSQPKAAPADPRMADVPQVDVQGRVIQSEKPPPAPDPSLVDKIKGVGETALSLATGATGGTLGMIGGALGGVAGAIATGEFGTPQGIAKIEQAAGEGAGALTYGPRTQTGQDYAQAAGETMNAVLPVTLMPELAAAGAGARAAVSGARDVAAPTVARAGAAAKNVATGAVERIRQASPEIAARIERTLGRNPDPTPTPGTRGSVGAAGTDMARQRREIADQVGVDLTLGQETRDQQQLRFEQETAKGENGASLRDRYSDQNEQVLKHFDNLVDQTGKESPDLAGTGRSVDGGMRAGLE